MGKFKTRLKGKGKRWPKGQSSSSNPETVKFRNAARSRFFSPNLGSTKALTIGALKTHDAFLQSRDKTPVPSEIEESSVWSDATTEVSDSTFKTFASDWSNCSNMSFSKLLNNFQSSSALHKEMLAVLAAITEVIKSNNGKESSTEYFAALMTALDVSDNEQSTAAILSLLSMGIKTVPQEVLRSKFSDASKIFLGILEKYSDGDNFVIIRSVIGCLSVLLRAQDYSVWSYQSTLQTYQSILVFTIFTKPKVRKAAQHAVCAVLKASTLINDESAHPAAVTTAKFCIQKIESSATLGGGTTMLHLLELLKEVLSTFPRPQLKAACEAILKLLTLGNVLMTSCCFKVLHGLFSSSPAVSRLTATLNAQLINALYDYQPAATDWQSVLAWLTVMQEAYCNLVRIDPNLCAENLLKLFTCGTQLWLGDNSKIMANTTPVLRTVALECLGKCRSHPNFTEISHNIFKVVEDGLKYQFSNAWSQVLHVLAAIFEVLEADAASFCGPCLKTLAELRDSYNFAYTAELEYTVGKAVRSLGPETVLTHIPLNITGYETNLEFKRAWLLPVLKENIQTSTIGFFTKYFLPLATIFRNRSKELNKAKNGVQGHLYDLLCSQVWALFPSFCNNPTDVAESFKGIAPTLGSILAENKDLRLIVLAGIRKLVIKSAEKGDKDSLKIFGRFAKNYLPIFFNIYTAKPNGTDEEGQRLATLDTIKVYLTVSDKNLCCEMFDKAFPLITNESSEVFMKEAVLDIIKVFLQYMDTSRIEKVYDLAINNINDAKTIHEEKKSYRLLEDLLSSQSPECKEFLVGKIPQVQKMLVKSLKQKKVGHAGARLRCLRYLVKLLPKNSFSIIKTIVPEVVLRCKDNNARTRECAFDLITEMFYISKNWSQKADDDMIRDYFSMVVGGLAGSPILVAATLVGLAKLTYTLRSDLPDDVIQLVLESVCLLLASPNREIATSCLSFVKTFVTAFPTVTVLPHLPLLVRSIVSMTDDCKRHSRQKVRDILDRLLRKYGYETIEELVPAEDLVMHKRLRNLRKINNRKKNKKSSAAENDDISDEEYKFAISSKPKSIEEILASSSDEEEPEEELRQRNKTAKGKARKTQMYIKEDDDDIVDLMSPGVASKLTATKPALEKQDTETKKIPTFKTASDGRFIISDLGGETHGKSAKTSIPERESSDEDLDDVASVFSIGKKRKMSVSSIQSEPAAKYQAGGSGIHRPIGKLLKKKQKTLNENADVKTGKEYRAKKARGDVKLRGKPDPFAYIPLSRKMLSKRKKAKMSGRFNNIIKSAVKGARAGSKAKARKNK